MRTQIAAGLLIIANAVAVAVAQPNKTAANEDDYYKLVAFDLPKGEVLEGGAIEFMPDGRLAFGTRRGEIWMVENPCAADPKDVKFSRYAHGLHEVLGLAQKDGWLYVTQRCDVSRIKDSRKNGKADTFEVVNDGWEINGDYHEYAFGSRFDKDGNIWVVLCLTGSFNANSKFRGWCLKVDKNGKLIPTCSGVRSPGGIGMNADGDMFYTDNQGPWNGSCGLKHLVPGGFVGHPDSFKWYPEALKLHPMLGNVPAKPQSGSRIHIEARKIPEFIPTAVIFPYGKMGQSAAGIDCDLSAGKFGPFEKQLFVGDQTHSTIMRVFLEKVDLATLSEDAKGKAHGIRYQGACFPFRQGLSCGIVPVRFARDGSLFAGGTNRGWGSRGTKPFSLERLVWTGKVPFEIQEMRARPDGFELVFTKEVDSMTAGDIKSYSMKTFTYIYQSAYGSPEVDKATQAITKVDVGKDKKSVRISVNKLQQGHIHHLEAPGVKSADGLPLLHKEAYYTLNYVPAR